MCRREHIFSMALGRSWVIVNPLNASIRRAAAVAMVSLGPRAISFRASIATARFGMDGFRSNEDTNPSCHRKWFGWNDVSLSRDAIHLNRSEGGEQVIGARMGSDQLRQHLTMTPREPIGTSHPISIVVLYIRRQVARAFPHVG